MRRFAVLAMLVAGQALAHHGWSQYDDSRPIALRGMIDQAGYVSPHGFVRLKTADKTWFVVLAPPARMERRGLTREMLVPGKHAAVAGYPNRTMPGEMRAERITIDEKTTELR